MIRKILSTTAARLLIASANLGIVWLAARTLGAEGMGTISLFILGISIIQMISAMVGGSALVYLVPRYPVVQLLLPSWLWAVFVSLSGSYLLCLFELIPGELTTALAAISLLQSMFSVNQNIQLGQEKVLHYNIAAVLQTVTVLITLIILFEVFGQQTIQSYITALFISYFLGILLSFTGITRGKEKVKWWNPELFREIFRFGGYLQAASFMQLFNYRLSYYIIEKYFDRATLGVFSIGVQISESVWIISKSIALVQYARISNSKDSLYTRNLTLGFIKFTAFFTTLITGILLMLPSDFFVLVFQSDFSNVNKVILSLSAGIIAVAVSLMFSHYFSGSGKPWHNTISSGIGLVFTIVLGFTLIPAMGIAGAGITASVSYIAGMTYQLLIFRKVADCKWSDFLIKKEDIMQVAGILRGKA
ncbi:hypothetical protein DSECCO2_277230 [anaerobic digester metagenome]